MGNMPQGKSSPHARIQSLAVTKTWGVNSNKIAGSIEATIKNKPALQPPDIFQTIKRQCRSFFISSPAFSAFCLI